MASYDIVVVGTSWGGLHALGTLVKALPADYSLPMVIVQHRHRESNHLLSSLLQERTSLNVCEVEDKTPVAPGNVYIAPADYHLLVEREYFSLSLDAPVRYSRPSIDVTFVSAADEYGSGVVGVVLTGANADGSRGLRRIADRGGLAVIQDPDSSESRAMPAAALRCVPTAEVLPMPDLARFVASLSSPKAAPLRGEG